MNTESAIDKGSSRTVSIVVPVLNEGDGIRAALARLATFRQAGVELVVVDGGSSDDTLAQADGWCDQLSVAPRGRGSQMNAGARLASGDVLIFLHADTTLPTEALSAVRQAVDRGSVWGRFDVAIAGASAWFPVIAHLMNLRSRWTGIATGDQAIFVSRSAFDVAGGFPAIPLMEDIAFSSTMRKRGRPACLKEKVTTSGRRWEKHGVVRTIVAMWWLRLRFFLGSSPTILALDYGYRPRQP